jgi:hypothetical protein
MLPRNPPLDSIWIADADDLLLATLAEMSLIVTVKHPKLGVGLVTFHFH